MHPALLARERRGSAGCGIATAAVRAFVADRFAALPLVRIFAEVYANNPVSVRVLEKAGFQYEGRLRKT